MVSFMFNRAAAPPVWVIADTAEVTTAVDGERAALLITERPLFTDAPLGGDRGASVVGVTYFKDIVPFIRDALFSET
jgi:hypothetical protein